MFQKVLFVVVVVYYFINRVEINTNMDIMNVKAFKKKNYNTHRNVFRFYGKSGSPN